MSAFHSAPLGIHSDEEVRHPLDDGIHLLTLFCHLQLQPDILLAGPVELDSPLHPLEHVIGGKWLGDIIIGA